MECLKNCCKVLMRKEEKEQETQVIALKMPPSGKRGEKDVGIQDDYLLSKLPPDGREVPFVVPTFKATYVQPRVREPNPGAAAGHHHSARSTYQQRKAELLTPPHFSYSPESLFHQVSPGSARREVLKNSSHQLQSPGRALRAGSQPHLSSSTLDLSSSSYSPQHLGSTSSAFSSTSSMWSSMESSLESIALSGDEGQQQQTGRVCVRMSYREDLEQVWITLVQCSALSLSTDATEGQKIGFKAFITVPKPIQFKSSARELSQEPTFMETFVFALPLEQLRRSALVLRLQTHVPRRQTVAESVLSLRQLGPNESDHWLDLRPPSTSPVCHSELQLSTCFQPVNNRIQLQVHAAQNLPPTSSPLSLAFLVKVEMQQTGQVPVKRKTRALRSSAGRCQWGETLHLPLASLEYPCSLRVRLYSRSSVRRKRCLGQLQLGFDSPVVEFVERWRDTMSHPEKLVEAWYQLSAS